jgi:dTDP-4-amino-4,6-dideoxygalactose transaminase
VSEDLSERILSLPVHPYLSTDDLQYVAEQVLTALV